MDTPTTVVIFGITGDLARKKLLPAFFDLFRQDKLPTNFRIVGFSRREFTDEEIREEVFNLLPNSVSEKTRRKFLGKIFYRQGIFDDLSSYKYLRQELDRMDEETGTCSNKLFYLAVPPQLYQNIAKNISASGLSIPCGGDKGWARILIEKPFGSDLKTAKRLDLLLHKLFKEDQIYRIDHYLAKETLQNILTFRFSNTLFEPLWNRKNIEKIEINLFEKNTVGSRGEFYDSTGALKDVGQNHILQMLALVTMEKPKQLSASDIRKERAKVLHKIRFVHKPSNLKAQYEGYLGEKNVDRQSRTETFFRLTANVDNARWRGVPIILSSGKALEQNKTEIKVYFKDPDPRSFLPEQFELQEHNVLTFRIQPDEGISILFWFKRPGFENKIEPKKLSFNYADAGDALPDAYERILYDCIIGDPTLFPTTREILSEWKFIESALQQLKNVPIKRYKVGSTPSDILGNPN